MSARCDNRPFWCFHTNWAYKTVLRAGRFIFIWRGDIWVLFSVSEVVLIRYFEWTLDSYFFHSLICSFWWYSILGVWIGYILLNQQKNYMHCGWDSIITLFSIRTDCVLLEEQGANHLSPPIQKSPRLSIGNNRDYSIIPKMSFEKHCFSHYLCGCVFNSKTRYFYRPVTLRHCLI